MKISSYVLSLETIVDIATLPPLFVMAFSNRQWIGFRLKFDSMQCALCFKEKQNPIDSTSSVLCSLRFMRFARILNLPDMLFFMKVNMRFKVWRFQHYAKVIEKSDNIRLAQITCQILAVFFMSAGGRHQISWKIHLEAGVHFSFDVLPSWADQGSCAHKCVC